MQVRPWVVPGALERGRGRGECGVGDVPVVILGVDLPLPSQLLLDDGGMVGVEATRDLRAIGVP